MKQIIFCGTILAFLYSCDDSDNRNAIYIKNIENKNNQLERGQRKKDLTNRDTTRRIVVPQLDSNLPTTTAIPPR